MLGWFISLLTFPGVAIHEFAHKKFCDWSGVEVFKVSYFRIGRTVGEVTHAQPEKYHQVFWISIGPLIINSFVALVASFIAFHGQTALGFRIFLIWISFSAGANACPSDHDMTNITDASWKHLNFFDIITCAFVFRFISSTFVYPVRWANRSRYFWFFYALLLLALGFWI